MASDVQAVLTAKTDQFESSLNRAAQASEEASKRISESTDKINLGFELLKGTVAGLAGSLTVGAFVNLIKGAIDSADHLNDLSKKTGIAVETLGGFGFAAEQAGGSLDSIATGLSKLNLSLAQAASGNAKAAEPFKLLGIAVKDAAGKTRSADVVFTEIAEKFANYADGPEKAALAIRIFGKAGADLIAVLDDGGKKLTENAEYFKRYSGVTQELAEKSDEYNDTLTKLKLLSGSFGKQVAAELLPGLQALAEQFVETKEKGTGLATAAEGIGTAFDALLIGVAEVGTELYKSGVEFVGFGDKIDSFFKRAREPRSISQISDAVAADTAAADRKLTEFRARLDAGRAKPTNPFGKIDFGIPDPKEEAPSLRNGKTSTTPKVDAFSDYLSSLGKDSEKLKFNIENFDRFKGAADSSRLALVTFDVELGKFSDAARAEKGLAPLSADQKAYAESIAATIVSQGELLRSTKALADFDDRRKQLDLETTLIGKSNAEREIALSLLTLEKAGVMASSAAYAERTRQLTASVAAQQKAREGEGLKAFTFSGQESASDAAFNLSLVGKTRDAIEDLTAARRVDLDVQRMAFDATGKQVVSDETLAGYRAAAERIKAVTATYTEQTRTLQRSATTGAQEFFNDYVANANDAASQIKGALTDTFNGLEDVFVNFTKTGKLNFKSLADTVVADLARISFKGATKQAIGALSDFAGKDSTIGKILGAGSSDASSKDGKANEVGDVGGFLAKLFGSAGKGTGDAGSAAVLASLTAAAAPVSPALIALSAAAESAASALLTVSASKGLGSLGSIGDSGDALFDSGLLASAMGNVFDRGNVIPFARGGVINQATMMPMALMGEAGPEAIVPLRRGRDGALGVAMGGGFSGGGDVINNTTNFTLEAPLSRQSQAQIMDKVFRASQKRARTRSA